ncbi:MAG: aminoacyl-tRNA hydrolase [Clostridia bacterium]|nr:aminoacyl-tRNA hydrolase [Clostridia bacterium]
MKLIVGLGNPGARYEQTFHNMGFLVLDVLSKQLNVKFKKKECQAEVAELFVKGERILLARPQTFMNLSGTSVNELLKKYGGTPNDLLVVYDDIDLERGTLRMREKGSGGTHNGMRNIIACINSMDFKRLRVGVGKPPEQIPLVDYVLCDIPKAQRQLFYDLFIRAGELLCKYIEGEPFERIMQAANSKV